MKIKVLVNLGTRDYGADALQEGVHEAAEPLATKLIARGLAVAIDDEPIRVRAVAPRGESVAEQQPVQVKPAEQKPIASKRSASNHKE